MKLGRRPPKNAPALRLANVLTGAVPAHPTAQDNLSRLSGWQMLGNDVAGDCVAVTWSNFRRLITAALAGREVYPTQDQVWQVYRTQNPDFDPNGDPNVNGPGSPADQGMDIQTLLEYLHTTGGPDGVKAVAFAKVDHTNLDEVKAALSIFGGVWTGITVQAAQMQQFNAGQPWDWVAGSPVDGGHSVLSGGYGVAGSRLGIGDVDFITWAKETSFTDSYWARGIEEAWIVIWPEHLGTAEFQQGVNLAALATDYQELTGKVLPLPTPVPTPPPVPADVDQALAAALRHDNWVNERHCCGAKRVAQAALPWLAAHHL